MDAFKRENMISMKTLGKGKKGQWYSALFVAFTLMVMVFSAIVFISESNQFKNENSDFGEIGEMQKTVLEAYERSQKILLYIDMAARFSAEQAVAELAKKGGQAETPKCEDYYGYSLWQSVVKEEDVQTGRIKASLKECYPKSIADQFEIMMNKFMNEYLGQLGTLTQVDQKNIDTAASTQVSSYDSNPGQPMSVLIPEGKNPSLSPETINKILKDKGSKAYEEDNNVGECFYKYAIEYGIDDAIPLAFFNQESSLGTKGAAVKTRAIGNIRPGSSWKGEVYVSSRSGKFRKYDSWCDGIKDWYRLIKEGSYYVKRGKTTIEKIVPTYAPNNPPVYIKGVRSFIEKARKIQAESGTSQTPVAKSDTTSDQQTSTPTTTQTSQTTQPTDTSSAITTNAIADIDQGLNAITGESIAEDIGCMAISALSGLSTQFFKENYGSSKQEVAKQLTSVKFLGRSIRVHSKVLPALNCVIKDLNKCEEAKNYKIKQISTFNWRNIRGGTTLSKHSFGIAIDMNYQDNPYCTRSSITKGWSKQCGNEVKLVTDMPKCMVDAFKRYGFRWGGDWNNNGKEDDKSYDAMHFEYYAKPIGEGATPAATNTLNSTAAPSTPTAPSIFQYKALGIPANNYEIKLVQGEMLDVIGIAKNPLEIPIIPPKDLFIVSSAAGQPSAVAGAPIEGGIAAGQCHYCNAMKEDIKKWSEDDYNTCKSQKGVCCIVACPPGSKILPNVPYYNQGDRSGTLGPGSGCWPGHSFGASACGPTSFKMAMHYFGIDNPLKEYYCKGPNNVYQPGGGRPPLMENVAKTLGMTESDFKTSGIPDDSTFSQIVRDIVSGKPTIFLIQEQGRSVRTERCYRTKGHFILGIGGNDDYLIINDPATGSKCAKTMGENMVISKEHIMGAIKRNTYIVLSKGGVAIT